MEKQIELLTVAKKFKDNNKIKFIRLSTRPDYIDDNILINLKKILCRYYRTRSTIIR